MPKLEEDWPVLAKLYWCPDRNVPLARRDLCSDAYELVIVPPGDYRLALPSDHERIRRAIMSEFGDDKLYWRIFHGKIVVMNKVPYMDEMKELIVDGGHAGKIYFDPFQLRWRFRLSRYSARIALEEGLVREYRLGRGEKLRPIIEIDLPLKEDDQVVITNADGEPIALGYYRGKAIHLQTKFGGEHEPLENPRRSTLQDVLKTNEDYLRELESKAMAFIHVMREKVSDKPLVVSFSGGKDSLVALHLTLRLGLEPVIEFNDTGLELPETIETVERTVDKYGLKLEVASAGDAFWKAVRFFGPPGKDYRWCCKVAKLAPMARLAKTKWPNGALNIVGQRAFESLDRARSPRVWRNRWFPQVLSITPIQYWNSFMIWLYIFKEKLEYNPLYEKGFERIGCFMCPAASLAEYLFVEEVHPELWAKWCKVLEEWRLKLGLPEEWVKHGLWRWLGPAEQKIRLARRLGIRNVVENWLPVLRRWDRNKPRLVEKNNDKIVIEFEEKLNARPLTEQSPVLTAKAISTNNKVVLENPIAVIEFDGKRLVVKRKASVSPDKLFEEAMDSLKILYRGNYCVRCRACEPNCPRGAIRITTKPVIDSSKCIGCRLCIDTCTIAEVYVEKIIAPQLLGSIEAHKRPSKRKIEDVVERAKILHGLKAPRSEEAKQPEETIPGSIFNP